MKTTDEFILLVIVGTVGLIGILLMINIAGSSYVAGEAYATAMQNQPSSISMDMTSTGTYDIYGKNILLLAVDYQTVMLDIEGVTVKFPIGEKTTYKGLGVFPYNGEEVSKKDEVYTANIDFYR